MIPEQVAVEAIAQSLRRHGLQKITEVSIAREVVEAISGAELLIVPAGRMAALLEIERAARALAQSDDGMNAALAGIPIDQRLIDPWPEADALVKALVEESPHA